MTNSKKLSNSTFLLRISIAFIFIMHAYIRIIDYTVPQFALALSNKGIPYSYIIVWAITMFEVLGSILLAFGYFRKIISIGFIIMLIMGIVLIHAQLGWFVGEHGTGGSEYSFILIVGLIVIYYSEKSSIKII